MLDDLVGYGFATRPLTELSETLLYEIVAAAAGEISALKWTSFPDRAFPWEQRVSSDVGERLSREVPTCAAAQWWSGGAADRPQVWLGPVADTPAAGVRALHIEGKPLTELWTSSALQGMPSAWWPAIKSGIGGRGGALSIWQLNLRPDAHVFEIRAPSDWRWLCETFPAPVVDERVRPDWQAAAQELDGVHLTVEGLIRTQGVEVATARGPAMLEDWDAESTAWLRWSFASVERLGSIRDLSHERVTFSREVRRGIRRAKRSRS
jgi:hypothetical protein